MADENVVWFEPGQDELSRLRSQLKEAVEALEAIASFEDKSANMHLRLTGSYSCFDEPNAVRLARAALDKLKEPGPASIGEKK